MDKPILGIQIAITSGCAVYYQGKIIYASSEERFNKVKNETLFPARAIDNAYKFLKENNYPLPEKAVIPSINMDYFHYLLRREASFTIDDFVKEQKEYYYPRMYHNKLVSYRDVFPDKVANQDLSSEQVRQLESADNSKEVWRTIRAELVTQKTGIKDIVFVNHEHSHAAYAFYAGDIKKEETLIIAVDGFGDDANFSVWAYSDGKLICHNKCSNFNVGRLYRFMTLLLGMKPSEHEYKVMGLAPYAPEYLVNKAYKVFENTMYFSDGEIKYHEKPPDNYFYFRDRLEGHRFDAIAGALQKHVEVLLTDAIRYWLKKLNKARVVMAGGVSLNIKANMQISELPEVKEIFVPASAGDESQCIGAIYAYLDELGLGYTINPLPNMYLGNSHTQEYIDVEVRKFTKDNADFLSIKNVTNKKVAELLSKKYIVGRFVGRMEFGARSLGNRAILADPSTSDIVKKINRQIKRRDFWMPFTPSIIDYMAETYLLNEKNMRFPFMTVACHTSEEGVRKIIGALHPADHTARPQIVTKETNNEYWDLLNEFYKITGIGALLNTSLNLSGLPICESPADVFHILLNSDLDMALLGTTLIYREKSKSDVV